MENWTDTVGERPKRALRDARHIQDAKPPHLRRLSATDESPIGAGGPGGSLDVLLNQRSNLCNQIATLLDQTVNAEEAFNDARNARIKALALASNIIENHVSNNSGAGQSIYKEALNQINRAQAAWASLKGLEIPVNDAGSDSATYQPFSVLSAKFRKVRPSVFDSGWITPSAALINEIYGGLNYELDRTSPASFDSLYKEAKECDAQAVSAISKAANIIDELKKPLSSPAPTAEADSMMAAYETLRSAATEFAKLDDPLNHQNKGGTACARR